MNRIGFIKCSNNTPVPNAKPFIMNFPQYTNSLGVPNGEVVPMGCEDNISMIPIFNKDIVQCPDGTLISISKRKIICNSKNGQDSNCERMRIIDTGCYKTMEWNNSEIMSLSRIENQSQMTKQDIEYAEISKRENENIMNNLTDEQKKLLSDLDNGKIIRK